MKTDSPEIIEKIYPKAIVKSMITARDMINKDVSNHIVLKELARSVGTNEYTLKKAFKDIFKITIYQYLLKSRMKTAERLLQTTTLYEKEIARRCGFLSLSGFITTFRKYSGKKPSDFRRGKHNLSI